MATELDKRQAAEQQSSSSTTTAAVAVSLSPPVVQFVKDDGKVRLALKELPIFGDEYGQACKICDRWIMLIDWENRGWTTVDPVSEGRNLG
jgi:hypothetical protein